MTTLERLQDMVAREYGVSREAVIADAELEIFGVDSLGMMELLFEIEKGFNILIPNEQVELRTIGQVAEYIDKLAAEQHSPAASAPAR